MFLCLIGILVFSFSPATSEEFETPYYIRNNELTRNAELNSYKYDSYLSHAKMIERLSLLQKHHSDKLTLEVAGKSSENRFIFLVKITNKSDAYKPGGVIEPSAAAPGSTTDTGTTTTDDATAPNNNSGRRSVRGTIQGEKPVIYIDAGIHAREWVAPAAAFYLIDKILETPHLTNNLEWYIVPMANPDGYEFSRVKSRFWRKNRAKTSHKTCRGVDLNRNFDVNFRQTTRYPCSETYGGPRAFSEPEARAIRDSLSKVAYRTQAYVTLHTYGQLILHPYGYTTASKPKTVKKLIKMGQGMANAIKQKYNNPYRVAQASAIGAAAGGSDDWAFIKMKVPYSYTFELQDRVNRRFEFASRGFILSPSKLPQAVDECWLGIKYMAEQILLERGLAHRLDMPPDSPTIGEDNLESSEVEEEELNVEESPINAYPLGWEQVVKEVQGIQARTSQQTDNRNNTNCVQRGNVFVCPHMVFWGSMFDRDMGYDK